MKPECVEAWRKAAEWTADAGAEVFKVSLPHTWMGLPCYFTVCNAELSSNLARYDGLRYGHRAVGVDHSTDALYGESRAEGFHLAAHNRIRSGTLFLSERMYGEYYTMGTKARRLIAQDFYTVLGHNPKTAHLKFTNNNSLKQADALLCPTTVSPAITFGEYGHGLSPQALTLDVLACSANLAGV
jgi:aspartyl-tRNA(Asn)/glutamyl-tRNA(Gln) amidotransferase subunit A